MEDTIGARIKSLRKEAGMTQTELAGGEMTKSMLSQIENNLAMPSMKNLQYIAERLKRPVSYLLDGTIAERKEQLPLNEIAEEIKEADRLSDSGDQEKAASLLRSVLGKYDLGTESKTYADIAAKLGKCLVDMNRFDEGDALLKRAAAIYMDSSLYTDAAKAYILLLNHPFFDFEYEKAIEFVEKAEEIYSNSITRDSFLEIEILHNKATIYSAMGRMTETIEAIDKALALSNEKNMFYNSDELYRLKASVCLLMKRYDDFRANINKALQFAEFTGSKTRYSLIMLTLSISENKMSHPEKALEYIEEYKKYCPKEFTYYYFTEKGKAFYLLGHYEKALESFSAIDYSYAVDYARHKEDFLYLWEYKVYHGLTLAKLGRITEGIDCINEAVKNMEVFPPSAQLAFACRSLSEVYSMSKDFENAYKYLKKADDTQVSPGLPAADYK
jgi:tetratricopeptide (TPR) repeat protein